METINCEIRYVEDESRQSPGRLRGTLITYEERALDRPEIFARGAVTWPENGIVINEQHNRQGPIVRLMPFVEGNEIKVDGPLPDTQRGRDAATNVREGILTGLSIEFHARSEGRRGGVREIRQAYVPRAALVDSPSYAGSKVEIRQSGPVVTVPSEKTLWL